MLNDSENLTVFFVAIVAIYGVDRFISTILYIILLNPVVAFFVGSCGLLQVLFLIFVAIFRIDDNPTAHYSVTGCAVFFGFVRECILFGMRLTYFTRKSCRCWFECVLNGILLAALLAFAITFGILCITSEENLTMAAFEYELFWMMITLPIIQVADVGKVFDDPIKPHTLTVIGGIPRPGDYYMYNNKRHNL